MKHIIVILTLLLLAGCQNNFEKATLKNENTEIRYIDRHSGKIKTEKVPSKGMLKWLYGTHAGKLSLHILFKRKFISALAGWYMNTRHSARRIPAFIRENQINLNEYQKERPEAYATFNEFFYRKIKPEVRPIGEGVVSPADGKILCFASARELPQFFIKGSQFTLETFLQNKHLAEKYSSGALAIIRLAPADYHRFHFPASGIPSATTRISGHYFSVSPLALRKSLQIFCENKREYAKLRTSEWGDILIVEVGATMVGSILQTYTPEKMVKKGDEKGYFAFGGSTLVLCFEKDKIAFAADLLENTRKGFETSIKMGESIASSLQ